MIRQNPSFFNIKNSETGRTHRSALSGDAQNLFLALLVGNGARGLTGGLAGGLALPTAAILSAGTQVPGLNGLDSFHNTVLQSG